MKRKILVIDDEPDILEALKTRIEANDYECLIACSPVDGLRITSWWKPDLIVLDLNMPKMSGYGVLHELKGDPVLTPIPILIFSALDDKEIVRGALDFGATGYINKMCGPQELMTMIQEYTP